MLPLLLDLIVNGALTNPLLQISCKMEPVLPRQLAKLPRNIPASQMFYMFHHLALINAVVKELAKT